MLGESKAFSGFAVDDLEKAKAFYEDVLGLKTSEEHGLMTLHLAGDRPTLVYPKPDHEPATYTVLNFPVDDIDAAFQSRIHVSIEYPDLTSASRRTIWANFLKGSTIKSSLTDKDIAELAELKLNGRQIKNVLKTAQLLAARKKSDTLDRKYIETVLIIEKKRPGAPQQMMHYL